MVYKLEFSKRFDRQFSKLDKSTQRYIFNWLIKHLDNVENSLGGTESLLTYPVTQTHPDLKPEDAERKGITRRLLRLSVGIEDTEDLIADLEQAFNK